MKKSERCGKLILAWLFWEFITNCFTCNLHYHQNLFQQKSLGSTTFFGSMHAELFMGTHGLSGNLADGLSVDTCFVERDSKKEVARSFEYEKKDHNLTFK